ncbi:MAG TPA: LysR family transcriptional regulator [Rhizomicrobium sp.]|nr:LysR family transcriptional regulator [Rhizomicrobium sp.]
MKQNFTVRQGALDGVEVFLSVARHKSFRRAAAELGVTPSAISQTVRALEARIGAALFIRTTRSVGLSEAGARFFARAKPAFEELTAAARTARDLGERPAGLLRITMPRAVVPILLEPLLASFARAYPEIELEIDANKELVDLAAGGFDAGIRLGQLISPDMTAVRMSPPFPMIVVGSPGYLKARGSPQRIEDLGDHACLRMRRSDGAIAPWSFASGNKRVEAVVSGPMIAGDIPTLLGAAAQGLGLAQVPGPTARKLVAEGKLVTVLAPFQPIAPGMFLYYPGRRQMSPKLRAFIDHVKSRASANEGGTPSKPRGKSAR